MHPCITELFWGDLSKVLAVVALCLLYRFSFFVSNTLVEIVFHLKNITELLGKLKSDYRRSTLRLARRRWILPEEGLICLCYKICNRASSGIIFSRLDFMWKPRILVAWVVKD